MFLGGKGENNTVKEHDTMLGYMVCLSKHKISRVEGCSRLQFQPKSGSPACIQVMHNIPVLQGMETVLYVS